MLFANSNNLNDSFIDVLRRRASVEPDRRAYTFLADGETEKASLTYGELDRRARSIGAYLQSRGARGERVLLLHPQGLGFVEAFFGCLYAGALAVPLYPPGFTRTQRKLPRLRSVLNDAAPLLALTTSDHLDKVRSALAADPALASVEILASDRLGEDLAGEWRDPGLGAADLAFLQYTSGSTSEPKGVMVGHGNLLHNSAMFQEWGQVSESSVVVTWLPLFHDMGLIGNCLLAAYAGAHCVLLSPVHFLQKPLRWLQAISRYGGTLSGGPNFAYELCLERITPEQRAALDLSTWTLAFNGAEPVRASTLRRFAGAFASCGLRESALGPGYGLAEATLLVTGKDPESPARALALHGPALQQNRAVPASEGDPDSRLLASCGPARLNQTVAIVDPETLEELGPDRVGEVWISGPSVAQGYWNRPELSEQVFRARTAGGRGPFLRTGDLGFLLDGELCVTGRRKDLLIIRGQNHYPQDVERTVRESHPALAHGEGTAFSVEAGGEERLVVVQEVKRGAVPGLDEAVSAAREAVAAAHDLDLHALVLLEKGWLPKTTSGKVQRSACRAAFLDGTLPAVAQWQAPAPAPPAPAAAEAAGDVERWLVSRLAARLGVGEARIGRREPFASFGLGSLAMIELAGELEERLGRRLSPTLLYDHPTVERLARALAGEPGRRGEPRERAAARFEPVAIVGIGCRVPGAGDARAFWRMLCAGVDAIREVPAERWPIDELYDPDPSKPGKVNTRWGGFLDGVDRFDPGFFGISPREAARIDPQQRLLLEVAWEALEDAGQVPEELAGSRTGVFVGISTSDYGHLQFRDPALIDAYVGTGNAFSIAANRISYFLDLHGPSLAVDTACSSSLVAAYLACQSLWNGDSDLCLAGGVNLILSPAVTMNFSRAGVMAPDGRCKAFDARGDGYVRGEGAGFVVLKPLSRAMADGDPVYAVIRGGATNQDGRTNGIMAPNGKAQEEVLREAWRRSGVDPSRARYVEAHGTGTFLGDPIEANALGAVVGRGRAGDGACLVGSVKTNVGHLEAAAGVTGLIKAALVLRHGQAPPNLHFETPNPHIDFAALGLRVPTGLSPLPAGEGPAVAGVTSLGFGGVNAHLVLEEAPAGAPVPEEAPGPRLFALSAHSPEALRDRARSLLDAEGSLADLCYTADVRRAHLGWRLAAVAASREELDDRLSAFLAGESRPGLSWSEAAADLRTRPVLVFPGQGGQWAGMGRELFEREPVFRDSILRCAEAMKAYVDWPLLEVMERGSDAIDRIQPTLFAVQVSLAALWRSWGIEAAGVVGHSMGEVAAAHVAGILSLEDALRVICVRSRLLRRTSGQGVMAVVGLPLDEAHRLVAGHEDKVSVAVSNSPRTTVLSGDPEVLERLVAGLQARDVFCRFVKVDVASHSPQMDPLREDLLELLQGLRPEAGELPLFSTVTGGTADGLAMGPAYWVENLRRPVLFSDTVARLLAEGRTAFVEVGPHPVLLSSVQEVMSHHGRPGAALPSMRREEPELPVMLGSLGALHTLGARVDWRRLAPAGRCVPLPAYPWQRERHWMEVSPVPRPAAAPGGEAGHPLLGLPAQSAHPSAAPFWQWEVSLAALPWLEDHRIQGEAVLPGAAYVEMALSAARSLGEGDPVLEEVSISSPLVLAAPRTLQLVLSGTPGDRGFHVYSRPAGGSGDWTLHAEGRVAHARATPAGGPGPETLRSALPEEIEARDLYRALADRGLEYGPRFQAIERAWRRDGEALAALRMPEPLLPQLGLYGVHPAVLDAAWQALGAALPGGPGGDEPFVTAGLDRAVLRGRPTERLWSHVLLREGGAGSRDLRADMRLLDEEGRTVLEVEGLRLRRLGEAKRDDRLYELQWRPAERPAEPADPGGDLLILSDDRVGALLAAALRQESGAACTLVFPGTAYRRVDERTFEIDPAQPEHYRRLVREAGAGRAVHLWGLGAPEGDSASACLGALRLVQALAGEGAGPARLWLVTSGAQPAGGGDVPRPFQAPLWGFARTVQQEHPDLRCTAVDLAGGDDAAEALQLAREIASGAGDDQVALRGEARFVARLARLEPASRPGAVWARTGRDAFRLEVDSPGLLDSLTLRAVPRRPPGRGEIEIEVRAAALNFMDVMKAMGMQPGGTEAAARLGGECAGRVSAVGEGVEGLRVGDEVVALAPHSFGSFAVASAALAAPKPEGMGWQEAAALPIAFLTAEYTLSHLARLAPGESVLIHAAAGGVGLAAVQVAQAIGAEIFATAGTPEKRRLLESLGVRHVLDSRTPGFADRVLELTGGRGVDVVLNSLAGELMARSLDCLAPYGRFVEIGKRDIYQGSQLGLRPFRKNLSFFAVDLEKMADERPAAIAALLAGVLERLRDGTWRPLPVRAFPMAEAVDAFRYMAQARHTGKVVLTLGADEELAVVPAGALRADATYLITGGLGGLGLTVAAWMAERGARSLVLLGRSAPSPEAGIALEALRARGVRVRTVAADAAREEQVAAALAGIGSELPPLRGIVHAAGILDDGLLADLDGQRFERVLAPKVAGAWNLHRLTAGTPLDFFVLFSSAASVLGSPGQANYAAANAFLDALAHHRRARGLAASSLNWGPWAQVGLAARPDRGGALALRGVRSLLPREGVEVLERLLGEDRPQVTILAADWREMRARGPRETPLLAELLAGEAAEPPGAPGALTREALLAAAPGARRDLLESHLCTLLARIVGLGGGRMDPRQPLVRLGVDSLMAVELKNRIESGLGVALPVVRLLEAPSVSAVAGLVLDRLAERPAPAASVEDAEEVEWEVIRL